MKRIIGSVLLFTTEFLSETDVSPMHSDYIRNVLRRNVSHDPTFGVYQNDSDCSFKIGPWKFKYNYKYVCVDGRKYKATQELWELLTKAKPDKNAVTIQDRKHINKYGCSLTRKELIIVPHVRSKQTRVLSIRAFFATVYW
jgi:hypothetical protein